MCSTVARSTDGSSILIVSLDFELYWGMRDKVALESYASNLLGARRIIPQLLEVFATSGVHATWATVGFLFFDDRDELLAHLPPVVPTYLNRKLSPYDHVSRIGPNEREDPFHFGRSLIRRILQYPGQEIGTHTFSHYYCLAEGQTLGQFRADLDAARAAARQLGIELRSLVFPRNQWRSDYLMACAEAGIRVVRGQEQAWTYQPASGAADRALRRAVRLADSYVNLSGHHGQRPLCCEAGVINVPSSRFLRPFRESVPWLTPLHLRRIRASMKHAAKNGLIYHLWWHPHNFGAHEKENLDTLVKILDWFRVLANEYGMVSRSMGELIRQPDAV